MSLVQKAKCAVGMHSESKIQPAVGGRNVTRCVHCDVIVQEWSVMEEHTWKGDLNLPRAKLPEGKQTDGWFKK